ncbi:Transposon TX1 uncharacterized 149 kDa protein [Stylophora pistillata]|uniref:Transposon TX1 uncharacterized 149 kDa protein n=1 Tax=Stylophora pistillata TaxID=50429 RepID=A0A2B4R9R2_STYPI|nr:Transposon TX1 uncharacterized 149 kDa protein [Stylophora pistillata]
MQKADVFIELGLQTYGGAWQPKVDNHLPATVTSRKRISAVSLHAILEAQKNVVLSAVKKQIPGLQSSLLKVETDLVSQIVLEVQPETYVFKKKGNEQQFNFNRKVIKRSSAAIKALESGNIGKAKEELNQDQETQWVGDARGLKRRVPTTFPTGTYLQGKQDKKEESSEELKTKKALEAVTVVVAGRGRGMVAVFMNNSSIRSNPRIVGLSLPGCPPLSPISQYADDTSLILTSDDGIKAALEVYHQYERASGSKINFGKSKGLWLGGWRGRTDSPVPFDWTPSKLKVLGVFIGPGNLEEDNWRPRISAVDHVLKSWRSRVLTFRGKALVINALALSRVWYVASLIHMPAWVETELTRLVFSFFWSGKRELVARAAVVQPALFGGFSVVSVRFKVWALLGQWVRRFASSPSSWVSLMSFWFQSVLGVSPLVAFSRPFSVDSRALPPFYQSLILAWRKLDGSFATSRDCLVYASSSPLVCSPVVSMSSKSCYLYLLSENMVQPRCVYKYELQFPNLDWPATWRTLSMFDLDRRVTDLNWKIAHGVLYTARRLSLFENYALQDVDKPLTFVTICEAPFELSDLAIIKRLAPYREVLHYRRGIGHEASECQRPVLCCICKEGHLGINRDYSWVYPLTHCAETDETDEVNIDVSDDHGSMDENSPLASVPLPPKRSSENFPPPNPPVNDELAESLPPFSPPPEDLNETDQSSQPEQPSQPENFNETQPPSQPEHSLQHSQPEQPLQHSQLE